MPRKRQNVKTRWQEFSETALWIVSDGLYPKPEVPDIWDKWTLEHPTASARRRECSELWAQVEEQLLEEWIAERPGTRPLYWWLFSAPLMDDAEILDQWRDCWFVNDLRAPRLQIRGTGEAAHVRWASSVPAFGYGIPDRWASIDPEDPPVFESQAAYLRRHGRLTVDEESRLTSVDFEPEVLQTQTV
jgi:hypothetical protein